MPTSNYSAFHPCLERVSATSRTAVYGPVRTVVWEARSREAPPYPDLWREADKTVVASIRLAGGCEGSHDFVDAGFKLGDRERFLKKRKRGRILTHRLIIIDAPPLCIHRDLGPVSAAMEAGRNKARRPTH